MSRIAIIGAGVSGISAAIEAKKAGLRYQIFEATQVFSTVANFPKAKPIYTYPTEMRLEGGLQFKADVKEDLLAEMEEQRRAAGIEVTNGRIERIERKGGENPTGEKPQRGGQNDTREEERDIPGSDREVGLKSPGDQRQHR